MNEAFRHLHMQPQLACDFLAVFSRMEYALKATPGYARDAGNSVEAWWDRFANDIDERFCSITNEGFQTAIGYLLAQPPRRQVLRDGNVTFVDQIVDAHQAKAQQTLLMVRTIRNNLFHGGKYLPNGEHEAGRNEKLVTYSLTVLKHCTALNEQVLQRYEH